MIDLRQMTTALSAGDASAILSAMTSAPVVQDQRLGRLAGREGVERWIADTAAWLRGLKAEPTELAWLATETRVVHELSLSIQVDAGREDLPWVLVADRGEHGVTEIRTYHSTWPYTGGHVVRPPPLAGRPREAVPEMFQWYIDRVREADVQAILERFTHDGYVREPSGDRWRHEGPDGREAFYGHLVHAPRTRFDLMTSTASGPHIAVEYGFAYGDGDLVGGVCVMETDGDRIAAVRITDDVGA